MHKALCASAALAAACCISVPSAAGDVARETRPVPEVRRVVLRSVADLVIHQGKRPALQAEAEPHLLPLLSSEVRDGTLYLDVTGSLHTRSPLRFHLTLVQLESLVAEGSGEVSIGSLMTPSLSLVAAGSGTIRLESFDGRQIRAKLLGAAQIEIGGGRVEQQSVAIEGSGDYRAGGLASDHAVVGISGSGNAYVTARHKVSANVYGSGEVGIHGNPRIEQSISGAGAVTRLGP